jgi:hypothetical protein
MGGTDGTGSPGAGGQGRLQAAADGGRVPSLNSFTHEKKCILIYHGFGDAYPPQKRLDLSFLL